MVSSKLRFTTAQFITTTLHLPIIVENMVIYQMTGSPLEGQAICVYHCRKTAVPIYLPLAMTSNFDLSIMRYNSNSCTVPDLINLGRDCRRRRFSIHDNNRRKPRRSTERKI